jgi:hypothetical protein
MILILFAAFAGAVQMIAPDHWMPASLLTWQRGWRMSQTILLSFALSLAHVLSGFALYLLFQPLLARVSESHLSAFTFILIGVAGIIRALRFSPVRQVLYRSSRLGRGLIAVFTLMGPSEMLIPVLMKAHIDQMDFGFLLVVFFTATWAAGTVFTVMSRAHWNRPSALPRSLDWCQSRMAAYPWVAAASVGIVFLTSLFKH